MNSTSSLLHRTGGSNDSARQEVVWLSPSCAMLALAMEVTAAFCRHTGFPCPLHSCLVDIWCCDGLAPPTGAGMVLHDHVHSWRPASQQPCASSAPALAHLKRLLLARGQDELCAVLGKQQGQLLSQALGRPGQPDNLQAGAGCERSVQLASANALNSICRWNQPCQRMPWWAVCASLGDAGPHQPCTSNTFSIDCAGCKVQTAHGGHPFTL